MVRLAPGGPFDSERKLPVEIEENLRAKYNLDDPLPIQYFHYLADVLRGDFGPSFKYKDFSVNYLILNGFGASLQIGGIAHLCAVILGWGLGPMAPLRQHNSHQ